MKLTGLRIYHSFDQVVLFRIVARTSFKSIRPLASLRANRWEIISRKWSLSIFMAVKNDGAQRRNDLSNISLELVVRINSSSFTRYFVVEIARHGRDICPRPLHFPCFWNKVIYRRPPRSRRYLLVACCPLLLATGARANLFNAADAMLAATRRTLQTLTISRIDPEWILDGHRLLVFARILHLVGRFTAICSFGGGRYLYDVLLERVL